MSGHLPVLLVESLEALSLKPGQTIVDCNLNRAGHSLEIAKRIGKEGTIVGIDLDAGAIKEARQVLNKIVDCPKLILVHDSFENIVSIVKSAQIDKVDGILFDLGLSSQELDVSGRGFTFQKDEPLLMTYQSEVIDETLTAKDILNLWKEETLADIIFAYGGERNSRKIAKEIVSFRRKKEFETTFDLLECVKRATPSRFQSGKTHFATKTFQAIRIAVNNELQVLENTLKEAFEILDSGGRLIVITFHSLEDKIVKEFFKGKKKNGEIELLYKKPVVPGRDEIRRNPRSRSSKLRAIIKI